MRRRDPHAAQVATRPAIALALLAVVAPQLLGGATPATELAILVIATATCAYVAFSLRETTLGAVPLVGLAAWLAAGFTLIQLVPLPCSLITRFWPERAELAAELVGLGALEAPVCTLSLAPGATRAAAAQLWVLGTVMLAAIALARAGQTRVLVHGVALSSISMACVALGHLVFAADSVFGLYAPQHARPGLLLAPLLNANNLAGQLALGLPVCLALGFRATRIDLRILWFAAAFVVCTTAFFTLSRGGAAACLLGAVSYVTYRWVRRRRRSSATLATASTLTLLLAVATAFGVDVLADQFDSEGASLSKLELSLRLADLVREHPLAGVGRGALLDASSWVYGENAQVRYAENLPIQWTLDFGLPVAAAVMGLFSFALFKAVRARVRDSGALWCGLMALIAQNWVDYGLEVPGIAVVAAVASGPIFAPSAAALSWARLPQLRSTLIATVLTAGVLLLAAGNAFLNSSRAILRQALTTQLDAPSSPFQHTLARALRLYPFDPVMLLLGSAHAVRTDAPDALSWLNLAMRVAPDWAAPHEQAAYWLERAGRPKQAAIELGIAHSRSAPTWATAACNLIHKYPAAEIAYETVGEGPRRSEALEHVQRCLVAASAAERRALAERVLQENPASNMAHAALVDTMLADGHPDKAVALARTHVAKRPGDGEAWARLIQTLTKAGRPEAAIAELDKMPADLRSERSVLVEAAQAAAKTGRLDVMASQLEQLLQLHGRRSLDRAHLHTRSAHLYASVGDHLTAAAEAQRAYELSGNADHAELAYREAVRGGVPALALRIAQQLCNLRHRVEVYCPRGAPAASPP